MYTKEEVIMDDSELPKGCFIVIVILVLIACGSMLCMGEPPKRCACGIPSQIIQDFPSKGFTAVISYYLTDSTVSVKVVGNGLDAGEYLFVTCEAICDAVNK